MVIDTTFAALPVGARFHFHDGVNHPGDLWEKTSDRQATRFLGRTITMGPAEKVRWCDAPDQRRVPEPGEYGYESDDGDESEDAICEWCGYIPGRVDITTHRLWCDYQPAEEWS